MVHYDIQWSLRDGERRDWEIRAELSPKWIRVKFGDGIIADSKNVRIVTEYGKLPVYYFPEADVRTDLLERVEYRSTDPNKGEAVYWNVKVGNRTAEKAVWSYINSPDKSAVIRGYLSFVWGKMDAWYEEDEEVFVHARDPYTRIDAIPSSRHIQVVIGGRLVADSRRPVIVYETGLTPRYYLPGEDVRLDLLTPTNTSTRCPYKGLAGYWSAKIDGKIYKDVVWSYREPLPEVHEIAGLLSFYSEAVDAVYIDGEKWTLNGRERLPYKKIKTI